MERFKSIPSFAGGLAGLLAFIFGANLLVARWGLAFVAGAYLLMFLALLVGFLIFAPGWVTPRKALHVSGLGRTDSFVLEGEHISGTLEITLNSKPV